MKGELKFFPALVGSYLTDLFSGGVPDDLKYWCKESAVYNNNMMLSFGSVYSFTTSRGLPKKDIFRCSDGSLPFIFVDSGGLQTRTIGLKVDIYQLLEYQNELGNWALILDYAPAGVYDSMKTVNEETVIKMARATNENIKIMVDHATTKLWGVLHGDTQEQIKLWYDHALADYIDNLYGVAVAFRPMSNYEMMVRQMMFLYEQGVKRVHLLGSASETAFLLSAYFLDKGYFDLISTDSSAYSIRASYGLMDYQDRKLDAGRRKNYELHCECPVCQRYNFVNERYIDTKWYIKLMLHNLWRIQDNYWFAINCANTGDLENVIKDRGLQQYVNFMNNLNLWE